MPSGSPSGQAAGFAQAFHSSAEIWLTEETASRVISDESMKGWRGFKRSGQPSPMAVVTCNIMRGEPDFKVLISGPEPFKDHLIGMASGARSLLGRAHGPGQ